ncbi:MAG: hypothetical protein R6X32_18245 [Chloroflexota bacterium]|jgi:hypothetical protein
MSHYEIDDVITRWAKSELTAEQAIGQILLILQSLSRRMGKVEKRLTRQRSAGPANGDRESDG